MTVGKIVELYALALGAIAIYLAVVVFIDMVILPRWHKPKKEGK